MSKGMERGRYSRIVSWLIALVMVFAVIWFTGAPAYAEVGGTSDGNTVLGADDQELPVYNVAFEPGAIGGNYVFYSSNDEGALAEDEVSAEEGQFFYDEAAGAMIFKMPDLPDEFTPEDDREFIGWLADDYIYEPGDDLYLDDENVEVTALWDFCKLTFKANNGTEEAEEVNLYLDGTSYEPITLVRGNDYHFTEPDDLVFRGWNTAASDGGKWYWDGDEHSFDKDTTLYARWSDPLLSICSYDIDNNVSSAGGKFETVDPDGWHSGRLSYGCNNYTAVKGDQYTLKAFPDNGYSFEGWYNGEYINQDAQGNYIQDARPYMDQLLSEEREYDFTITDSITICPVFRKAPLVNFVDIENVWTALDPINEVPFTAETNTDEEGLSDFIEISDEAWTETEGTASVSELGDGPVKVEAGKTYTYSVTIKAVGDAVFDPDNGFRFVYGGKSYKWDDIDVTFSDDNKTAVISGFIPELTVEKPDIATASISGLKAKTYTGKAQTQSPVVTLYLNGTELGLIKDTDYTVSYSNNVKAGTATVTITGKGDFTGTASANFKINKASVAKASVSGLKAKVYTGKAQAQAPVVKVGTLTLKKGTDYTIAYKNNKAVGLATMTITGKGNYTGTISKNFKIIPKGTYFTKFVPAKGGFTAYWNKQTTQTTGYVLQYALNNKFTSGAKKVVIGKNTTYAAKVSKLRSGKRYYLRVCTFRKVGGKYYYSTWSKVKYVTTK